MENVVLKRCSLCGRTKPVSEFDKHKAGKHGLRSRCKPCNRLESRNTYKRHPESYKRRAREFQKILRPYLQEVVDRLRRESGCNICGEMDVCCLDFHHLEKGVPVTRAIGKGYGAVETELAKCVILCANCHRKVHAGRATPDPEKRCRYLIPRLSKEGH